MNTTKNKKGGRKPTTKSGGSQMTKQISDLAVPFGLILAKESLQQFLNSNKSTPSKKVSKSKRVSLSGGMGCSKKDTSLQGAPVGGSKKTPTRRASLKAK